MKSGAGQAFLQNLYLNYARFCVQIPLSTIHKSYTHDSEEHKNAHMLQLADLLLGLSLRSCYVGITAKKVIAANRK
jgi:hypothetical protein